MKHRWIALLLVLTMVSAVLPVSALAASPRIPIYIGYADVDYMAEQILQEIPTAGKSATEQIRAVYDWIIQHCSRYSWDGTYYFDQKAVEAATGQFYQYCQQQSADGKITLRSELENTSGYSSADGFSVSYDSNLYIANFAYEMMMTRTGNCAHYSALLALLLGHLGFDCRLIPGDFVNRDGSAVEHKWNYVLVDGQYYWLDVRMDHASASGGRIDYYYFMKADTTEWDAQHNWDHGYSDWLAANAADIQAAYDAMAKQAIDPWSSCSAWAADYMQQAGKAGLIPERLEYQNLTRPISRAEFAAVAVALYEALGGSSTVGTENPFTDTKDPDVLAAYALGFVNGVGEGRFAPDKTLTRQQAAAMMGRVYERIATGAVADGSGLPQSDQFFDDAELISAYAAPYIYFFVLQGVIDGVGNDLFAPHVPMTREQALKIAAVAAEKLG